MVQMKRGYHCVYDAHYHIVFPIKYRKALLDEQVTAKIKEVAIEIQERYEIEMESIGCDQDHIHLLCSFHPKYGGGRVVQIFKSITARELFRAIPQLKKDLWGGEFWSDGYYLATVGTRGDWSVVEKYVRSQGKKPEDVQLRMF